MRIDIAVTGTVTHKVEFPILENSEILAKLDEILVQLKTQETDQAKIEQLYNRMSGNADALNSAVKQQ